ncbi:MAG: hypothetical protein PXX82_05885 [Methanomassiliicoccales archaeon]|nr:hypothetical protein [Methanomassiliicoccales archaeon]
MKRDKDRITLSVRERITLHIHNTVSRLGGRSDSRLLTQAGIAESLLITRAHAAIELDRGIRKGLFASEFAKLNGADSKWMKVYTLTPAGVDGAKTIAEAFEKERIVREALKNPGAQPILRVIESLDDQTLIRLCAMRLADRPLNASSIGVGKRIPLTVLEDGMISLSDSATDEIDSLLGDDTLAKLAYGLLADSCLRTADYPGRMKYLTLSGRYREADRTATMHASEIEIGSDDQLTGLLRENESCYAFGQGFYLLLARLCIRDGKADEAVRASLRAGDGRSGRLVLAESLTIAESIKEAENIIKGLKSAELDGKERSAFHRIMSRISLAEDALEKAVAEITLALNLSTRASEQYETRLNYELLAKIERRRGNYADASRAESKLRSLLEFGRR